MPWIKVSNQNSKQDNYSGLYNHSADENKSIDKNQDHSWMEEQFSQNDSNLRDSMSNNDV